LSRLTVNAVAFLLQKLLGTGGALREQLHRYPQKSGTRNHLSFFLSSL
jgi:hypothetical protein